tara:strand:+ start:3037 stop:3243 length:207 start_codon:yes stop_codon:yes gene_type:complete
MKTVSVDLKKETVKKAFLHTAVHKKLFEQLEKGHPYYDLVLEIKRSIKNRKKKNILKRFSIFFKKKFF